jgi:hypothetical protein
MSHRKILILFLLIGFLCAIRTHYISGGEFPKPTIPNLNRTK